MRQKKSKKMLYILILSLLLVAGFVLSRDLTIETEHVEEVIENNFSKR